MSEESVSVDFFELFKKAILFWPTAIDVTRLYVNDNRPELYVVIGLGETGDAIVEKNSTNIDAVLMVNLHDAITSTIRSAAQFSTHIEIASLRPSVVRERLEKRLKWAAKDPNLGWKDADILLIERYFSENEN